MAATIRDVAAKANVSFQLVSAVLGGKKYARASAEVRKRITDAAQELGYVPNISARILQGGTSKMLGVIIDSRAPESAYSILAELEQAADHFGYRILTAQTHDNPEKLLESYRSLKQNGVDGIFSFSHDYPLHDFHLGDQIKNDPKLVFVLNAPEQDISCVDTDFASGMKTALDHLYENGYRKPSLLLINQVTETEKLTKSRKMRMESFLQAVPDGEIIYLTADESDISDMMMKCRQLITDKILPLKIDSVIAQNDNLAAILMKELLAKKIRIPQDIGLIGWDNLLIGQCLPVQLTTIFSNRKKIAETALTALLRKINGETEITNIMLKFKMIVRESTLKNKKFL